MSKIYSPEELNSFSKETLVAVILSMQDQLSRMNTNMERLIANVKHFFTLLGKMFFTLYGKEFFTYPGKKIFTSLRLPVGTGQGASAGRIPRGKSNTWHGAGSGPTSQW